MGETTQLKRLFGADLSNLVYVDVLARVCCSLGVIHPASSIAQNLSGRVCLSLWANRAVLRASGFQPPLLVSKSLTFTASPEELGMTDRAVLTKNGTRGVYSLRS